MITGRAGRVGRRTAAAAVPGALSEYNRASVVSFMDAEYTGRWPELAHRRRLGARQRTNQH